MAQFMGVPGPSQDEFNALYDRVTALNSKTTAYADTFYNATSSSAASFQKNVKVCFVSISIQCDKQLTAGTEYEMIHGVPSGCVPSFSFTNIEFYTKHGSWTFRNDNVYFTPSSTISINSWLTLFCTYITP